MNIEEMRSEFEAAIAKNQLVGGFPPANLERCGLDDEYVLREMAGAWWGWQASRESLVIELPDPFWPGYIEEEEGDTSISTDLFTREQLTEAIQLTGAKVK